MILRHDGLKGGGDLFWAPLLGASLDKEAVGQAAKHAQDPYPIITLHQAAVIVVGYQARERHAWLALKMKVNRVGEERAKRRIVFV
jgi:hypothetical protein